MGMGAAGGLEIKIETLEPNAGWVLWPSQDIFPDSTPYHLI